MLLSDLLILASLLLVLIGTFVLRNIRRGVVMGLLLFAISRFFVGSFDYLPFLSGLVIAFELFLLIVGALVFYNVLAAHGHFTFIDSLTQAVPSRLTLVLILGTFLGSFFEGIAGFGIPAMLIAPLLVRAGISTFSAILISLSANIGAVTFGALGTPLKLALGIYSPNDTVHYVLLFNALPIFLLPTLIAFLVQKSEKMDIVWKQEWKRLLGAGLCFVVPYGLMGLYSVEFPSVVAGAAGLILFVFFFIKNKALSARFWGQAFYPYLLFIVLLLLGRHFLQGYRIVFGEGLRTLPLYQPGLLFLLAAACYLLLQKERLPIKPIFRETLWSVRLPMLTIVLLVSYTQLVRGELASLVGQGIALLPEIAQKVALPVAGVCGAFITGSATMSNLLLMNIAQESAVWALPVALALLHTGSALGNMIALQNIVMVKSALKAENSEREVIRFSLLTLGAYLLLVLLSVWIVL